MFLVSERKGGLEMGQREAARMEVLTAEIPVPAPLGSPCSQELLFP